jgi:hypothetical protein
MTTTAELVTFLRGEQAHAKACDYQGEESQFKESADRIESLEQQLEQRDVLHEVAVIAYREQLEQVKYRHECLKGMYSNEMNYLDDDQSVDDAIDNFILEEESHS